MKVIDARLLLKAKGGVTQVPVRNVWIRLGVAFCFALQLVLAQSQVDPSARAMNTRPLTRLAEPEAGILKVPYQARCVLPGAKIQFASPAVGNLDGDAALEIVVGASDGWVHAVKLNGSACVPIWSFDTEPALNARAFTPSATTIRQAPTIADLDGDGWNEVVVPVGSVVEDRQNGGVVVLSHDGQLMPGWPQLTFDKYDSAYTEGVASSPAVADLDGDGTLEIIAGAFDHRVYAWHHDGSWVEGWPRHVFDTVWSSPAVGDLDGDGLLEVVIGVDSAENPYYGSINGGALYAFHHDGSPVQDFPVYVMQNFESTPALVDLDGDGHLDIVVGGGSFYNPGSPSYKVHAFDRFGRYLPGWPVSTGGHVTGSPAIADLDRDGRPDVVVGSWDGRFYAWRYNGTALPGWPMRPRVYTGENYTEQKSAIVVDRDGAANPNGRPEVFLHTGWEVVVVDAGGVQVTWDGAAGNPQNKPTYYTDWTMDATPVAADVDADGKLELIAGGANENGVNATLYVWELPDSRAGDAAPHWPMFKRTQDRLGSAAPVPQFSAAIASHNVPDQFLPGQTMQVQIVVRNTGTGAWTSSSHYLSGSGSGFSFPGRVDLPAGATVPPGALASFSFSITAPLQPGFHTLNWRMAQAGAASFGRAIALRVKAGNEPAYYVLRRAPEADGGGVYPGGLAAAIPPPSAIYPRWENKINFQLTMERSGYFLLDENGFISWAGTAPDIGSISAEPPAVELVLGPDRQGYFVINANGRLWWGGGYMEIDPLPPVFSDGRVVSFAVTRDYKGVYVLDKHGTVYRGGTAQPLLPATPVFAEDVALKIRLTAGGTGYYVLDRYGRVHNGGSAPALPPNYTPRPGEDWARDFELTDDETGYYLLDRYGGIHAGGAAIVPALNTTPIWNDGSAAGIGFGDSRTMSLAPSLSSVSAMATLGSVVVRSMRLEATNGLLAWQMTASAPWLALSPQAGSTPGEVVITADPRGLPLGTHHATITIRSDGAANSPLTIPVRLAVVNQVQSVHLPLVVR